MNTKLTSLGLVRKHKFVPQSVLVLNQGHEYNGGVPQYGELNPETPDDNIAVLLNVRKLGLRSVVSGITSKASAAGSMSVSPVNFVSSSQVAPS